MVDIEEDEYTITASFNEKNGDVKIMICLYKMGEDDCAIELK